MKTSHRQSQSETQGPALIPIKQLSAHGQTQSEAPLLRSPFFRPSNPRLAKLKTPGGREREAVVIGNVPIKDEEKKSSLLGAWANLCNVTIGAGIVGLPYAIDQAGMVSGTIMIVITAIMTDYSLRQVITTGKRVNVNSYETLMEATFGRPGFIFLTLSMFFLSYGAMLAYLTIIKDVLPIVFGFAPDDEYMKRVIMMISSLLIILPLSMQRDMADLEKTSRLNVVLNLCLVGMICGYSPIVDSVEVVGGFFKLIEQEEFDTRRFFVGFGVASFAFVCQDSSFIIAGSLDNPTKSRWKVVTQAAMSTCCTLELIMGICGYLAYQENTLGNVLNNMDIYHWSGLVSRAILATTMFFAYPMNLYVARHACVVLFFDGISAHEGDDHTVLMRKDRRVILTWILYIATLVPAMININTGLILSATGAIGGSSLAYIVPGVTFMAVYHSEFIALITSRWHSSSKYLWGYPPMQSCDVNQTVSFSIITWYFLLMPLWSSIARLGERNVPYYIQKENSLSPGLLKPRRLAVVPPANHSDSEMGTASNNEGTLLINPNSQSGTYGSASDPTATRLSHLTTVEIQDELKEENFVWAQFYIAMMYVLIGIVAMTYGIMSIVT